MMAFIRNFQVALLAMALPLSAFAGPQYSADDIVGHFKQDPAAAVEPDCPEGSICLPKKGTRAVCIGAASACAGSAPAAAKPPSAFDLLITFELGSDELSAQARENLEVFARALQDPNLSSTTFNVDGHTDARGSDAFNRTLSERRAAKVVEFLQSMGVDRARLEAKGHGEDKPRDTSDPFAAVNRRVEATIRTQ
jgi:outer membrane protein OmpA-like peptidoglycan-associated protein